MLKFEPPPEPEENNQKKKKKKYKDGRAHLLSILLTKSTYLIWKLKNERKIQHGDHADFKHNILIQKSPMDGTKQST